jgi:hypothetical protein
MTEQQVQTKLMKDLEDKGYYVIKLIKTNKNGIPDLIAIPKNSDVEFYEVKKSKNREPRELQKYRIKELQNHGIKAEVFYGREKED